MKMVEELDILFIGKLFSKKDEGKIRSKLRTDMQDAANVLQWNLIDGFIQNGCKNMTVVSYIPVDSWPKHYSDAFVREDKHIIDGKITFNQVGFCNITKIKQVLNANVCDSVVKKWASKNTFLKKVIVCYTCDNVLMRALRAAKKVNPNIEVVQIIADITEFEANDTPGFIRRMYIKYQINLNNYLSKFVDKYVLLTELMKVKLGIEKPYIVMEGIVPQRMTFKKNISNSEKIILYTGSLNKKYGITQLLAAFAKIESQNYRLVICGLGDAEKDIISMAESDSRINFMGKVLHKDILNLQCYATVLVNPRQNNEEFTKYSFPSKNLEYLSSGVPLVAYKLDGIPNEYDEYINYVQDNSIEALKNKIVQICELSDEDRFQIGQKAKNFVLKEKNAVAQTKKILELIKSL